MSLQYHKTILIVCEGEGTEPDYFNELRDLLLTNKVDVSIEIRPRPKNEVIPELFKVREGGKRRQLQKPAIVLPISEVEDQYKAQPTRYVREAQLGLTDGTYDEVWAVFDKDGHPQHQEAFELAENKINEKKVNIAFSSIAFEYWILLHFERNTSVFEKSMCREAKMPLNCGTKISKNDCNGVKCVCGRIVSQGFLKYVGKKKSFEFSKFHQNVNIAIENAILLRKSYISNPNAIYELTPYTNTDRLVFKLIHLAENDFLWFDFNRKQSFYDISFLLEHDKKVIKITIENNLKTSVIINEDTFCLIDIEGNILKCGTRIIVGDEIKYFEIDLNNYVQFNPIYLGYRLSEAQYLISEIP